MSREIKFRVWDKVNKKMITYETMCACPDITLNGVLISHDKQSNVSYQYDLMQYTGLKDKNGTKAYHHDIVKSKDYDGTGQIVWLSNGWAVMVEGFSYSLNYEFTIIGDIHTTPQLMEAH